jgi:hypothetical protein
VENSISLDFSTSLYIISLWFVTKEVGMISSKTISGLPKEKEELIRKLSRQGVPDRKIAVMADLPNKDAVRYIRKRLNIKKMSGQPPDSRILAIKTTEIE